MLPRVSVVIPTYNHERFIKDAVECALAQSVGGVEVVVVDDGSIDKTCEALSGFGSAIRLVRQENVGQAAARNRGIEEARGEYVAFLDGDDVWLKQKLERQLKRFAQVPEAGVCSCAYFVIDHDLRPIRISPAGPEGLVLDHLLLEGNVVGPPTTVVVRRQLLDSVGGFDPALGYCSDWDLWIRLARRTRFCIVAEPLAGWRIHDSNLTRRVEQLESDSVRLLQKALDSDPEASRSRAATVLGRNWFVLAGSYFGSRNFVAGARCLVKAAGLDPLGTISAVVARSSRRHVSSSARPETIASPVWPVLRRP